MKKEIIWLEYFNPCGAKVIEGYGNKTCVNQECGQLPCLQRAAYIAAMAILDGSNNGTEKIELDDHLASLNGKEVIGIDGKVTVVGEQNKGELIENVLRHSNRMINGVESCVRNTSQIDTEIIFRLPIEEQVILNEIYALNQKARDFRGEEAEARDLAVEIQSKLQEALKFGLGEISLIARQALAYGLADELPFIDATGLIFLGDPLKIIRFPRRL